MDVKQVPYGTLISFGEFASMDSLSGLSSLRHPALRMSRLFHESVWKRRLEGLLSTVMHMEEQ